MENQVSTPGRPERCFKGAIILCQRSTSSHGKGNVRVIGGKRHRYLARMHKSFSLGLGLPVSWYYRARIFDIYSRLGSQAIC